jgi:hypothetical protein
MSVDRPPGASDRYDGRSPLARRLVEIASPGVTDLENAVLIACHRLRKFPSPSGKVHIQRMCYGKAIQASM